MMIDLIIIINAYQTLQHAWPMAQFNFLKLVHIITYTSLFPLFILLSRPINRLSLPNLFTSSSSQQGMSSQDLDAVNQSHVQLGSVAPVSLLPDDGITQMVRS
jgi:hypothetical protein